MAKKTSGKNTTQTQSQVKDTKADGSQESASTIAFVHSAASSISIKSTPAEMGSRKVSEMIDGLSGGLASSSNASSNTSTAPETTETGTKLNRPLPPQSLSKGQKKRLKAKAVQIKPSTDTTEALPLMFPEATNPPSQQQADSQPVANIFASRATLSALSTDNGALTSISEPVLLQPGPDTKTRKIKNNKTKNTFVNNTINKTSHSPTASRLQQDSSDSEISSDTPLMASKTKITKTKPSKLSKVLSVVTEDPRTTEKNTTENVQSELMQKANESGFTKPDSARLKSLKTHKKHKSFDVRVKINGQEHRSVSIDSPATPSAISNEQRALIEPLKIKLPGGNTIVVDASSNHKASSAKDDPDNGLESRLQSMILSHASDAKCSRASSTSPPSLSSDVTMVGTMSPVDPKTSKSSQSAEESSHVAKTSSSLQGQQQVKGSSSNNASASTTRDWRGRHHGLQAPPSLPPPQLQNVRALIPEPHESPSHPMSPNGAGYNPLYYPTPYHATQQQYYSVPQTSQPFYSAYAPSYSPMPFVPASSTIYEAAGNGMVYYNADGSQMYPLGYGGQPLDPYAVPLYPYPPQHYDPYSQHLQHSGGAYYQ